MKKKIIFLILILTSFSTEIIAKEKFLSLKNNKVNVRYCPELKCPIKYIYKKINYPIKQIDKKENFRRIIDIKKNSGWIHISQLKISKSFIVLENKILFKKPSMFSKPLFKINKGRLLIINRCEKEWCNVQTDNHSGWIRTNDIWGYIN
jgi:SH3-like domain-containing protein